MNAIELAEYLEDYSEYERAKDIEAATMLRKQHEAIVKLREALIAHQKAGVGNSTDYATQHVAHMSAHKALITTEEIAK